MKFIKYYFNPTLESISLLEYAAKRGSIEIFQVLSKLNFNAPISPKEDLVYYATIGGNKDVLEYYIKIGFDNEKVEDKYDGSLLFHAIFHNKLDSVRVLYEHKFPFKDIKQKFRSLEYYNALEAALFIGHKEPIVYYLVESGEIITARMFQISVNFVLLNPPYLYLAQHISKEEINKKYGGSYAVQWICNLKRLDIARIILEKGINVNLCNDYGHTAFHYVSDEKIILQFLELFSQYGLDVNAQSITNDGKKSNTILADMISAIKIPYKAVEWLLAHGARTDIYTDILKDTIINYQQRKRNIRINKLFEKYGHIKNE